MNAVWVPIRKVFVLVAKSAVSRERGDAFRTVHACRHAGQREKTKAEPKREKGGTEPHTANEPCAIRALDP